jgi:hypothetical protein
LRRFYLYRLIPKNLLDPAEALVYLNIVMSKRLLEALLLLDKAVKKLISEVCVILSRSGGDCGDRLKI